MVIHLSEISSLVLPQVLKRRAPEKRFVAIPVQNPELSLQEFWTARARPKLPSHGSGTGSGKDSLDFSSRTRDSTFLDAVDT